MKRLMFFISFLIISFLIAGCQFEKEPDITAGAVQKELKIEKQTGILNTVEGQVMTAAFKLTTDSNEDILLRSGSINLRKYEKRRVEIEGNKADDGIFEVSNVTKIGREDDTRELYRNTRLGFVIQYVSIWDFIEKDNEVVFTPYAINEDEKIDKIYISKLSNEKKLSPEDWLELNQNYTAKDPADDSFYAKVVVGVDNLPGIKRTSKDGTRIGFFVSRETSMYRIIHETIEDEDQDKYRSIFFDMVNGFQFVAYDAEATSTVSPVEEVIPVEKPVTKEVEVSSDTVAETARVLPKLPDTNDELGATLESRGFKIKMSYPKKWYWEQIGKEIQFTDKPSDEDEVLLLKLGKFNDDQSQGSTVNKCKEVEDIFYCFSSQENEFALFESMMQRMLDTIELIPQP